jgi:hypothetical protein
VPECAQRNVGVSDVVLENEPPASGLSVHSIVLGVGPIVSIPSCAACPSMTDAGLIENDEIPGHEYAPPLTRVTLASMNAIVSAGRPASNSWTGAALPQPEQSAPAMATASTMVVRSGLPIQAILRAQAPNVAARYHARALVRPPGFRKVGGRKPDGKWVLAPCSLGAKTVIGS